MTAKAVGKNSSEELTWTYCHDHVAKNVCEISKITDTFIQKTRNATAKIKIHE